MDRQKIVWLRKAFLPTASAFSGNPEAKVDAEWTFRGRLYIINDYYKNYPSLTYKCILEYSDQNELYSNTFTASVTENSSTAYEFLEFKLPSDISNCFYIQLYLSDGDNVLSENNYRLLVGDQKAAQETAYGMYKIMYQKSREYGKGYYRYFPDMF